MNELMARIKIMKNIAVRKEMYGYMESPLAKDLVAICTQLLSLFEKENERCEILPNTVPLHLLNIIKGFNTILGQFPRLRPEILRQTCIFTGVLQGRENHDEPPKKRLKPVWIPTTSQEETGGMDTVDKGMS